LSIIAASFVTYSATLGLGKHTALVAEKYGPEILVKTAYWQILGYRECVFRREGIADKYKRSTSVSGQPSILIMSD
jgi:hypothetical protein